MISLRTKDEVTLPSSERLFRVADDPESMMLLDELRIAKLIYPAGFYRTKARSIREASRIIVESHRGKVPSSVGELTALPGVGRKTANLVLNLGFGIPAICVDTHVHRISNRFGWVHTTTPNKTETALAEILPRKHWIETNELLVGFGKQVCTPQSPRCSQCPFAMPSRGDPGCARAGVDRHR
jgi:endonuclease-3